MEHGNHETKGSQARNIA
jgi:hypothetical protein